jgi:serine/threonine protein kinase
MLDPKRRLAENPPPMPTQPLTPLPEDAPDPLVGQRLGDFVVEAPLASGGMGVVYRARHPLIGRQAAIKVLRPEFAADAENTDRFLKEAQALAAIKHRGIIEIIGFGNTSDGRQYMATEFLDGESLERVIARESPMTPMRVLGLVDEVLNALSAAHKSQVVHRDLKPSNVFLATQSTGERIVKLLDFGLAKQSPVTLANVQDGALSAKASLVAGTPEYIAPEQARGFAATPRTDLYCVGVMMFEMLSGTLPFKADTIVEMLKKHVYEPAPRLSGRVSNLPDALVDLVMGMLEKDPERRPASAELVRQTVQRITRQLQQDATVQRANPLRVVPAPFRMAESEAPTPPLDPKQIQTERVIRPVEAPASIPVSAVKHRRWPILAALLLLLLIPLGWKVLSGGPKEMPVPPPPTAPQQAMHAEAVDKPVEKPVEKPAEAAVVPEQPVKPPDEDLAALPTKTVRPKPAAEKAPGNHVAVEVVEVAPANANAPKVEVLANPQCANLPAWRQDELDRADDIGTRARAVMLKQSRSNDEIDSALASLRPIRNRIQVASNGDQCSSATGALTAWAQQHGL